MIEGHPGSVRLGDIKRRLLAGQVSIEDASWLIRQLEASPLWSGDLGPLQPIAPDVLLPRTDLDHCMLALALLFNDFKDLVIFDIWVSKSPPASIAPTPYFGQWGGLRNHIRRLVASLLHEFLRIVRLRSTVIEGDDFQRLLVLVPDETREAWTDLIRLAKKEDDHGAKRSSLSNALQHIRDKTAFHYADWKPLAEGYRSYFGSNSGSELQQHAFVSFGDDMDATRFYYADAAAHSCVMAAGTNRALGDLDDLLSESLSDLNRALGPLLRAYLGTKTIDTVPQPQQSKFARTAQRHGGRKHDQERNRRTRSARKQTRSGK